MPALRLIANILDPRQFATACPGGGAVSRALLFVALAWLAGAMPARADGDIFTVRGVNVDRSAASAAAARDLALADGQAQAFRRLVARLVPQGRHGAVPVPSAEGLTQLVQDFGIDQEKTSPVRYIAVLEIRFNGDAVQRLLRTAGVPFAVTPSRPLVVLPVYRRAGALQLWDRDSPWLQAWQALPPSDGLVPLVVPEGDLADIADIGADQALKGDEGRVAAIARRHGASGGLLAYAVLAAGSGGGPVAEITVSRIGGGGPERTVVRSVAGQAGENEPSLLARAAIAVRDETVENWKRDNLLRFDQNRSLMAVVPLANAGDWARLRRALDGIAFVERSELLQLSRNEATVQLSYLGDEEQLMLALAQRDLDLTRGPDSWLLRMRGTAGPNDAATPPAPQ